MFVTGYLQEEKQKYDHLLENAKKDLEVERQTVTQLRLELDEFRRKYEETQKEVEDLNQLLSSQRKADIQHLEEDKHKTEKIQKLREESSVFKGKLEEERKKSEELLSQVNQLGIDLLTSEFNQGSGSPEHRGTLKEQKQSLPPLGIHVLAQRQTGN